MIRDLVPGDAAAVAALDAEIFGGNAWSPSAWQEEAALIGPDRRYVVLDADGEVAGYAGILRAGSDADILTVAVAPARRSAGAGSGLVRHLLEIAQQWRCLAVFLEVEQDNESARRMYRGLGFAEIGVRRHYYGPDRHGVTMRRQVREPMGSLAMESEQS